MSQYRGLMISIAIIFLTACGPRKAIIRLGDTQKIEASSSKNILVNIRNVSDSREVVLSGENPAVPQLATVKEINPTFTSTIAAQIRNLLGNVHSDIFTEKKITTIVKNSIEESFRRAGYNVSNSAVNSIPIDVIITQFWAYNTGFWVFTFHFDISVEIIGDLTVLHNQQTFSSNIHLTSVLGAAPRSYKNTINKGMDKFIRELAIQLLNTPNDLYQGTPVLKDTIDRKLISGKGNEYYSPQDQQMINEPKGSVDSLDGGDEYYSPEDKQMIKEPKGLVDSFDESNDYYSP